MIYLLIIDSVDFQNVHCFVSLVFIETRHIDEGGGSGLPLTEPDVGVMDGSAEGRIYRVRIGG